MQAGINMLVTESIEQKKNYHAIAMGVGIWECAG